MDVCKPDAPPGTGHFLVPKAVINSQQPEDVAYLWAKGAFSIPSNNICEALFQSYFRFVHPLLPILDVDTFLSQYTNGGTKRISALLLWSMFSVAGNVSHIHQSLKANRDSSQFVNPSVIQIAGYGTRKEMKRAFYQRAKVRTACSFQH